MTTEADERERIKEALSQGFAWPGGYPLSAITHDSSTLCCSCALEELGEISSLRVHWEGATEYCDDCGEAIESAYGDPQSPSPSTETSKERT